MTDFINRNGPRPKFLNLLKIRMPIMAIASILHRLSGFLLFLLLPLLIYGIGLSLKNPESFQVIYTLFNVPLFQWAGLIIIASLFYHLIMGIRFLLMDLNIGHNLNIARGSAWLVVIMAVFLFVVLAVRML